MQEILGCENKYKIFFHCDDCKYKEDRLGCAGYRSDMDAVIGFELRG